MNDYIKREDALNMDFRISVRPFESRVKTAERAVQTYANEISKIPAADVVKRKRGHCLPKARYFYCSECGYAVADVYEGAYDHDDEKVFVFEKGESWHFRPNCGANMREEN